MGATRQEKERLSLLKRLKTVILGQEQQILQALFLDLHKSAFEAYSSELVFVLAELDYTIKCLKKWMRPKSVSSPWVHFPARSYIYPVPFGRVLIIGAWNYPFQFMLAPLIGALAAGNTAVLKPSEIAPHTSALIKKMIADNFSDQLVSVVEGGVEETTELLQQKFDYIFYTGSSRVGRIIMEQAAKNLTPVTLELGGKSPCVIGGEVNIDLVVRRIVWGKFYNVGQTCVAPDYLLVEKRHSKELLERIKFYVEKFYGKNPQDSCDYGRIISARHFARLNHLLEGVEILLGGERDEKQLYFAPTILKTSENAPVMQEEIFGPLLPVFEIEDARQAVDFINKRERPLALYVFSCDKKWINTVVEQTTSGGVCINDTLIHLASSKLPFGGVGESGMGHYHGKYTFDTFTHYRSVMKRFLWAENPLRYPPYKNKISWLKRAWRWGLF